MIKQLRRFDTPPGLSPSNSSIASPTAGFLNENAEFCIPAPLPQRAHQRVDVHYRAAGRSSSTGDVGKHTKSYMDAPWQMQPARAVTASSVYPLPPLPSGSKRPAPPSRPPPPLPVAKCQKFPSAESQAVKMLLQRIKREENQKSLFRQHHTTA